MRLALSVFLMIIVSAGCSSAKVASLFVDRVDYDAWYIKAGMYEQDKNYEEASRLLEAVLETINDEHVYLRLAQIYSKMRDETMMRLTLERGLRKNPESVTLMGELAVAYSRDKKFYTEAKDLFKRAYEKSEDPAYAVNLARVLTLENDFNSAIKVYDGLIKKFGKSEYYIERGKLYQELGLENDSIADFEKAADIDENFFASTRLADHYLKVGDDKKAVKYLRMIIRKSPDMVLAKFRLAELLRKIGDTSEAVTFYENILDQLNEKEKIYVLKQVAGIYYRNKNYDRAEIYFKRVYEIDNDIQTAYSLALMKEAAQDYEGAVLWYEKILEKRPDFNEAVKRLAIIHIKQNRPEKAFETIEKMEEIYRNVDYFRIKAEALISMDKIEDAREILRQAIEENPTDDKLYIDLAISYEKFKDYKNAIAVVRDGMKFHKDNPSYQNFLGYMFAVIGENLQEAKELIGKALEKKPEEPAYLDSMAWVLYKMGRYEEAYPIQKRALKGAPDEQEIREHMEEILKKLNSKETVEDILEED